MEYIEQVLSKLINGPLWVPAVALCVTIYLVQAIAYWGIFKKAGENKWKGFVPIYNLFTQLKISWSKVAFWIYLLVIVIALIPNYAMPLFPEFEYAMYVKYIGYALVLIMELIICIKLSKSFGHKFGYAIGLLFLPQIFMLVLGLGNSEYVGGKNGQ